MAEIVYVVTNEAMPGLVKIGKTRRDDLGQRIKELGSWAGVPLPFEVFYACEVIDAGRVERQLHDAFGDHRVSKSREFFRIAPERVRAALSLASLKEIKLNEAEVFESPEQEEEPEVAKRRTNFNFSMVGIKPGTELKLEKKPEITCTTVDERNKVDFRGDTTSLSDAALQAVQELGFDWSSASGPWEWTYEGKRLDDIRREIEGRNR